MMGSTKNHSIPESKAPVTIQSLTTADIDNLLEL